MDAQKQRLSAAIAFFFVGLIFGHMVGYNAGQRPPINPYNFQIETQSDRPLLNDPAAPCA
ncbi:MAG: hypothetical protein N0C90_12960 [Candidatus Thiodiazotropha endolucinida]|nr:hypothetical protein [Candidatus Thiodiazotropha taylori]MCW4262271.1 hypothetical protein [Candidatus Thiodiazotropha endolucinida]